MPFISCTRPKVDRDMQYFERQNGLVASAGLLPGTSQAPQVKAASNEVPLVTRQLTIQKNFNPYDYYVVGKGFKCPRCKSRFGNPSDFRRHWPCDSTATQPPVLSVARVADDASKGRPIFNRKTVLPPQGIHHFFDGRPLTNRPGRAKRARKTKNPNPTKLRLREANKPDTRISCCNCHKMFERSVWAKHLSKPCFSLSLTRAEQNGAEARARASRKQQSIMDSNNDSHPATEPVQKTPCVRCGKSLSALAMEIHIGGCNKARAALSPDDFPFVLLPPSMSDDFHTQIKRFFVNEQTSSQRFADDDWDQSRLDELELLNPKAKYFGRKGWFGYCVYEFPDTLMVVLETALRNNATYVVGANWKDLISLTKPEIRLGDHQRIFHLGNYWRRRVERALWKH
jgi:hypothetical protein